MSDAVSTRRGPDALSLVVEESDSSLVLRLAGGLDLATIGSVMAALDRVDVERTTRLVFDLQEVDFLDAAGLHALVRAHAYCKDHELQVTVIKPRGLARRVFTLTRVHRELDLVDSAAAADPEARRPPQKAWLRRLLGMDRRPRTQSNANRPRSLRSG
ncbi:MAG: STAS domain-containing protein [Actinomycetota bacterium]|nr:STAS domain-containing protein [Actinomycetota bacterium]MDQ3647878.1 STAS domain-containing protein [Actinomycetota bacterium]